MIEKIISIKNIGRFHDCKPCGDVTFRRLTLIFAENGRGKTTLCSILRSLATGLPEYIYERKTLGVSGSSSAIIRLNGHNFTFGENGWSSAYNGIVIFDSVFVHENVYSGDYVSHEQKKNLYKVIVGPKGVQLAKQIDELDEKIRVANADIRTKRDSLSVIVPSGTTLEEYLAWQTIEDIEVKINQKKAEIDNLQRILDKATEIQSKGILEKINLPAFPTCFLTLLSKKLSDVVVDAEARVRQQIKDHSMENRGETWLSQGLDFVVDNKCPFCGQSITANELIYAYRSHFNVAYKELKQEVAQLSQKISNKIGETSLNTIQQTLSNNLILVEYWKQFAEIVMPPFDFKIISKKYSTLRDHALMLVQRKQQSPTEPITPGEDFQTALNAVTSLLFC